MESTLTAQRYYVNGEWKESTTGNVVEIMSPYKEGVVGTVQALSQEEAAAAIQSAKQAQKAWAKVSLQEKADLLYKWADELLAMQDELAQTMMLEVGKSLKDAKSEVQRTYDYIRYTAQEALHTNGESMRGDRFPGGSSSKVGIVDRVPLGVILAISPFNYPVNLSASKLAPALISGNTVIFKPATQGALSGIKMMEAFDRAGFPAGVVNIVTGRGSVIGDFLVEHKDISMVSFTGGTKTGENLAKVAGMKPVVLELGGKDPGIVREDADLDKAVKNIISGAYSYSGQRCTAIKRVLVHDNVANDLVARLQAEVEKLAVGSPEDGNTVVPLIDSKSADGVQALIDDALEKGATLIAGNKREGNLIHPTLLDHVTEDMDVAWVEPFGPVLPVIRVGSDEEAIELANKSEYGLQASIFTRDVDKAFYIANELETGAVQINGRTERGPDHFPFLGVKGSGMGTQGIANSILSMTREKLTVLNLDK
ncbi:NADP-dependent glyceraldehyde-3-phosphate dehydrogenase [Terribacillus saccharophilus]|uniref:NADP-dependent glyceraldehyde-3-phosphate dehydrogenase n=1 Tax=Terribacillus saccharophilus TaxID=361277 RepID=UPI001FED393A|nr:NADP-dependent glyceraldehyde-3-phosphate dehydrogenase [Terribacillus goriensis]